jgi:archaellum biogenesis ATPase FlaH
MDENFLEYEYYSDITAKEVDWLWYPYIPYGKITLLQGDPGEGKSTFILQLTAILTRGGILPDGTKTKGVHTVIYQCAEDSNEDTIKPRLMNAGADCSKVAFIVENDKSVTLDDSRIEEAIITTKAKMLVLDPIQAFIPSEGDMLSATKMRGVMRRLAKVAEKNKCAVVLVGHMNKAGGKNLYRGLGSIDIAAIARSILMIERDAHNPQVRYMFTVKSNLTYEGCAIGFMFDPKIGFQWIGRCNVNQIINDDNSHSLNKKEQAKEFLHTLLSVQDIPSTNLYQQMSEIGISERTVRKAKKEMNIQAYKKKNVWYWHLKSEQG